MATYVHHNVTAPSRLLSPRRRRDVEIHRRRRRLPQSVTSSKLVPERDTSWMRGALMERKGCNRKEEIWGGEKVKM